MIRYGLVTTLALIAAVAADRAQAQETEVRNAVTNTLDAWATGDFAAFTDFYHPDTRGFFMDGGILLKGVDPEVLQAGYDSGFRANLELRELDVKLYGDVAVSVAYLDGSLTLPAGAEIPGTWRYSETRVRDGSEWRVVQFHFSEMKPLGR